MDLTWAMRVMVEVANLGSFAAAAGRLDMSKAAASRQIAALEAHLGARLFQRTTRRVALTEAGQEFHDRAVRILADTDETVSLVGQHALDPCGQLRISAPVSLGTHELVPILPEFCRRYPKITLELDFTNRLVDLINEGVDVALRLAENPGANLVARKLAPIRMVTCASPAYLAEHGTPRQPGDLAGHAVLGYSYLCSSCHLRFVSDAGVAETVHLSPRILSNAGAPLSVLAREGLGVLIQPDFLADQDIASGALVSLLEGWSCAGLSLFVVYPSRAHLPLKVRVFVDHVVERLGPHSPPAATRGAKPARQGGSDEVAPTVRRRAATRR